MFCEQKFERRRFHVRLRRPGFQRHQVRGGGVSVDGGTQQRGTSPDGCRYGGPASPVVLSAGDRDGWRRSRRPVAAVRRPLAADVPRQSTPATRAQLARRGRPERLSVPHRRRRVRRRRRVSSDERRSSRGGGGVRWLV